MKQQKNALISPETFRLSVFTALLAQWMNSTPTCSARAYFLKGFLPTMGVVVLGALTAVWAEKMLCRRVLQCGLFLWFGIELAVAVRDAAEAGWQQFGSMAVIGFLPLLLWAGWTLPSEVFSRTAAILWRLFWITFLITAAGLLEQMHWQNLLFTLGPERPSIPIYAEYFALPFLRAEQKTSGSSFKSILTPLWMFALEGGLRLGTELIFGGAGYPGGELLRCWAMGAFSRFDSAVLLVWLAAALFRICFLVRMLRLLAGESLSLLRQKEVRS